MLSKKQLEDAAKCDSLKRCKACSLLNVGDRACDCINAAAKTALAYREILERLEWQSFAGEYGFIGNCPMCGGASPGPLGGGHEPGCELAALLQDEIADIKAKCNPRYDLTILDVICTLEGCQETLKKAREALKQGINQLEKYINRFEQTPEEDACIEMHEAVLEIDKAIGGGQDVG